MAALCRISAKIFILIGAVDMIDTVIPVIVYFSSGLMLFRAFAQLIATRRHVLNVLNFISLLSLSIIPVHLVLVYIVPAVKPPVFYFMHLTLLYLPGPASLCYLAINTKRWFSMDAKKMLHFAPAAAVFVLDVVIQVLPAHQQSAAIAALKTTSFSESVNMFNLVRFFGLIHIVVYLVLYLCWFYRFYSHHKMRVVNKISLYSILYSMPVLLILIVSHAAMLKWLVTLSIVLSSLLITFWYLVSYKVPEFLTMSREAINRGRYERSRIDGIDSNEIQRRLRIMMEDEKAFCDEDITLRTMAGELSITTHQLSEFLNARLNMSFKSFINTYRVEEAKKILRDEQERSILSVAYAVGFNSRSNFNRVFYEFTGETPSDFRERHIRGSQPGPQ
jgi:AraC-like DNA-binding protein